MPRTPQCQQASASCRSACSCSRPSRCPAGGCRCIWASRETTPRLDNVHRFLAGIYFGCGLICLWAAITVRQHRTLVLLIGLAVFLAGSGRLLSISIVGLPEPPALWLGYLVPELLVSVLMVAAQLVARTTEADAQACATGRLKVGARLDLRRPA